MLRICRNVLYYHPLLNLHRIRTLGLTIHHGLISKSIQHSKVDKFKKKKTKIMVSNLKMKHKSKTMWEVIGGLLPDFVFTLLLDEKVPFTCNFSTEYNIRYIIHHFDVY